MSTSETLTRLREIGEHVEAAAKSALKDGVDSIVTEAKSRCPVKSGKLRDSIHAKSFSDGAFYKILADAKNDNGEQYGAVVEWSPKINRPFLHPALEANREQITNNIKDAIRRAVNGGL